MSHAAPLTFRRATHADIAAILPMMVHFNVEEHIDFTPERGAAGLEQLMRNPSWGFVQLVELDEQAVAYALVTFGFDIEYGGRDAFLNEIFVARGHRQKGIGRALIEVAEASARDADVCAIHLLVRPDNVHARGLYESVGFKQDYRPIMTKSLL